MEKVKKIAWSKSVESALTKYKFTPDIINEIKTACTVGHGEIYTIGKLTIVTRVEMLSQDAFEVVWMASYGADFAKYKSMFVTAAKRGGARFIRFHVAEDERAIVRAWRSLNPISVSGWDGAYRIDLEDIE